MKNNTEKYEEKVHITNNIYLVVFSVNYTINEIMAHPVDKNDILITDMTDLDKQPTTPPHKHSKRT